MRRIFGFNTLIDEKRAKYKEEIQKRIDTVNAQRGRILTLLVVFLEIALVLGYDIRNITVNGWNGNYAGLYLILHLSIMLSSLLGYIVIRTYVKNPKHPFFKVISFKNGTALIAFLFLLGITLINGIDQTHTSSISMFLFFVLMISLFTILKPKYYLGIYIVIYIIFVITMIEYTPDATTRISNLVNGSLGVATSLFIAIINYAYVSDYVIKSIELELVTKQLEHLSITDQLTDLYNRRKFIENLNIEIARSERSHQPFSLLMIDIDHFKEVNDSHGHLMGDSVLKELGASLRSLIRVEDTIARYGGEEFAIILTNTNLENAVIKSEQLRTTIQDLTFETNINITISIGVTTYVTDDDYNSIVERADQALYDAKNSGRNRSKEK